MFRQLRYHVRHKLCRCAIYWDNPGLGDMLAVRSPCPWHGGMPDGTSAHPQTEVVCFPSRDGVWFGHARRLPDKLCGCEAAYDGARVQGLHRLDDSCCQPLAAAFRKD